MMIVYDIFDILSPLYILTSYIILKNQLLSRLDDIMLYSSVILLYWGNAELFRCLVVLILFLWQCPK